MACIGDSNVASAMGGVLSIISTSLYPDIPTIMCCTIASASSKAFAMKPPITTTDLLTSSTSSFSNMLPLSNVVGPMMLQRKTIWSSICWRAIFSAASSSLMPWIAESNLFEKRCSISIIPFWSHPVQKLWLHSFPPWIWDLNFLELRLWAWVLWRPFCSLLQLLGLVHPSGAVLFALPVPWASTSMRWGTFKYPFKVCRQILPVCSFGCSISYGSGRFVSVKPFKGFATQFFRILPLDLNHCGRCFQDIHLRLRKRHGAANARTHSDILFFTPTSVTLHITHIYSVGRRIFFCREYHVALPRCVL